MPGMIECQKEQDSKIIMEKSALKLRGIPNVFTSTAPVNQSIEAPQP